MTEIPYMITGLRPEVLEILTPILDSYRAAALRSDPDTDSAGIDYEDLVFLVATIETKLRDERKEL